MGFSGGFEQGKLETALLDTRYDLISLTRGGQFVPLLGALDSIAVAQNKPRQMPALPPDDLLQFFDFFDTGCMVPGGG